MKKFFQFFRGFTETLHGNFEEGVVENMLKFASELEEGRIRAEKGFIKKAS